MKLYEAIHEILKRNGSAMTTREIADELNRNGWYKKKDGSLITDFQIHGRTKNYSHLFNRDGTTVSRVADSGLKDRKKSRSVNPKWHRDEIMLALDIYFQLKPGQIHAKTPQVIELSEILNKLPIHESRPDKTRFRNPNGVGLKLSNFLAIDPSYKGKGMEAHSRLDKEIFDEFVDDRGTLRKIAKSIRKIVDNKQVNDDLRRIDIDLGELPGTVREGQVIFKLHRYRERDSGIVQKKKSNHFKKYGRLRCEACDFDFHQAYGELGTGFIECHHKTPLSTIQLETQTRLDDLTLVCSNCHRMLHRRIDTLSVGQLRKILQRT